ncbi:Breast cancer type 2 susceptibility protein [Hirschfeldia incana]|nr:Breast cancer type 2 susceptibility protein [Hirschfeldia incana]
MSTWQLSPDSSGDGFRWEAAGRILQSGKSDSPPTTAPPLPSMADLLLRGCSKLIEPEESKPRMFTTALGKSVALKESSISRAKSILADSDDNALSMESEFGVVPNSLFQTASNKKVNVSSSGMARAKALLGLEEDDFSGSKHANRLPSSSHQQHGFRTPETFGAASVQHRFVTPGGGHYEGHHVSGKRSEVLSSSPKVPQTKFQTAGGRSLSVSVEALNRARSLLGDPELGPFFDDVGATGDHFVTPQRDKWIGGDIAHEAKTSNKHTSNSFISPLQSSSKQFRSVKLEDVASGVNLIKKFDAAVDETHGLAKNRPLASDMAVDSTTGKGFIPRATQFGRQAHQPLVDITNRSDIPHANNRQESSQKKRLGKTVSVPPFKRPRTSSFKTPLMKKDQHASSGFSVVSCDTQYSKRVLSTRPEERSPRIYIKDYFGMPPTATTKMDVPEHVRRIKSSNAHEYVFGDVSSSSVVGAETFLHMLAESGASLQRASREWVTNHYRWIVWKLACYETYYPDKCRGNFLTINNVLQELRYRYEREVNHGHRSAIKRILSGDAPASSTMVLCISAISPKIRETRVADSGNNVKIELTDGWYSINAALDVMLQKQLNAGKLFIGQKLRILGAGLSGWTTPTSPLEVVLSDTIYLLLNINGTYRAHWADRLGFCKEVGVPLALNCIKCNGGPVPKTLAGITRIYPILYKEKLGENKSVVRSERMEWRMIELHNQRRSDLIEGLICEYQGGINGVHRQDDTDTKEGAKLFKLLESAAEPDFLMADMSMEELNCFNRYKEKFEAAMEKNMEKSVAKALEDAGLGERNVTPFMRIRLVGLTSLSYDGHPNPKEAILTIWNPTETQRTELAEGKIYAMKGLVPMNIDSETLFLHARGSSSSLQPLSPKASENFQPFFNPRKSISLLDLGEIPLGSEFDMAAYVVYVGNAYTDVDQKKQWVFVIDGSLQHSDSGNIANSLLAISFSTSSLDDLHSPLISHNLVGSVVGFCNLIKRAKDVENDMWVCEAMENSDYFLNADAACPSHLKFSSGHIQNWANLSFTKSIIHQLRQRALFIVGAC